MTPSQLYWELEDLVGYDSRKPESVDRYNAWISALRALENNKLLPFTRIEFEGCISKAQSKSAAELLVERAGIPPEQILAIALVIFQRRLARDS